MGLFFRGKNKRKAKEQIESTAQPAGGEAAAMQEGESAGTSAGSGVEEPARTEGTGSGRQEKVTVTDSKGEYLWNSIDDFSRSSQKEVRSSLQIPGFYMGSGKNLPEMSEETKEELLADIRGGSTEVHIADMRFSRTKEDFESAPYQRRRRGYKDRSGRQQDDEPVRLSAEEKFAISRGESRLNTESAKEKRNQAAAGTKTADRAEQPPEVETAGIIPAASKENLKTVETRPADKTGRETVRKEMDGALEEGQKERPASDQSGMNDCETQVLSERRPGNDDRKAETVSEVRAEEDRPEEAVKEKDGSLQEVRAEDLPQENRKDSGDSGTDRKAEQEESGEPDLSEDLSLSEYGDMEEEDDETHGMDSARRSILSMVVSLALVGLVMVFVFSFKTFLKGRTYHKLKVGPELGLENQYESGSQYLELDPDFMSCYIVINELPPEGGSQDLIPGKRTNSSVPLTSGQILRASERGSYQGAFYYQLDNGMYVTANGKNVEPLRLYVPVTGSLAITYVSSKGVKLRRWPDFQSTTNVEKYVFVGDVVNVTGRIVLSDGKTGAYITDEGLYIIDDQKYFDPHVDDPTRPVSVEEEKKTEDQESGEEEKKTEDQESGKEE